VNVSRSIEKGFRQAIGPVASGAAGAGAGLGAYGLIGGVGVAAGGTAVGVTAGPFIAIGAGVALAGYGLVRLGRQIGLRHARRGVGLPEDPSDKPDNP
jgi:hypothetical protein